MSPSFELQGTADGAASSRALDLTLDELIATRKHRGKTLAFSWREPIDNFKPGDLRGLRRGSGFDLDCIGPYQEGDDYRHIDWFASARSGRTQVKRFLIEIQSKIILVLDLRQAMFFGTAFQLMAKTMCLAAAELIWTLSSYTQPLGLAFIHETAAQDSKPERGRRARLKQLNLIAEIYQHCLYTDAVTPITLADPLHEMLPRLARDAEIILLSDFSAVGDTFEEWCRNVGPKRLRAVVIEDAMLETAPPSGNYPARSMHDSQRLLANIRASRTGSVKYLQQVRQSRRDLYLNLKDCGIRHVVVCNAESVTRNYL